MIIPKARITKGSRFNALVLIVVAAAVYAVFLFTPAASPNVIIKSDGDRSYSANGDSWSGRKEESSQLQHSSQFEVAYKGKAGRPIVPDRPLQPLERPVGERPQPLPDRLALDKSPPIPPVLGQPKPRPVSNPKKKVDVFADSGSGKFDVGKFEGGKFEGGKYDGGKYEGGKYEAKRPPSIADESPAGHRSSPERVQKFGSSAKGSQMGSSDADDVDYNPGKVAGGSNRLQKIGSDSKKSSEKSDKKGSGDLAEAGYRLKGTQAKEKGLSKQSDVKKSGKEKDLDEGFLNAGESLKSSSKKITKKPVAVSKKEGTASEAKKGLDSLKKGQASVKFGWAKDEDASDAEESDDDYSALAGTKYLGGDKDGAKYVSGDKENAKYVSGDKDSIKSSNYDDKKSQPKKKASAAKGVAPKKYAEEDSSDYSESEDLERALLGESIHDASELPYDDDYALGDSDYGSNSTDSSSDSLSGLRGYDGTDNSASPNHANDKPSEFHKASDFHKAAEFHKTPSEFHNGKPNPNSSEDRASPSSNNQAVKAAANANQQDIDGYMGNRQDVLDEATNGNNDITIGRLEADLERKVLDDSASFNVGETFDATEEKKSESADERKMEEDDTDADTEESDTSSIEEDS
ncbi:hypothetical protein HK101_011834 [Irineochytrium annulatum]|nr:hypothetical protein HK101_011834 [Irineochytrium annulatum]